MPAHAATIPEYCEILARSKLVPEAEVQALRRRWTAEARGAEADVDGFRRFLVQNKCLTEYQAALIQRGHSGGFFIGGYVILDRIGKGASAGVYRAVHSSGQVVALKVLPASRAKDPHVLTRFQREGRLLTQLDHPNVVRAFQVGQSGYVHFIVMEHLDGETLDEVLARRKRLPPAEAVRVVFHALQGLQHLFEKRMVHRDLKPTNLMACPPPAAGEPDTTLRATIKILDVGIGRELFLEGAPDTHDAQLTTEGALLGTPDYLAPEQARDARSADIRADVYSAGCVLFHLLAGRPPFAERNVMAQMVKHATETPAPLASVAEKVPPGLQAVFDKLTAKRPDDRFQTPASAAEALRPFLPAGGATATAPAVLPAYKQWLETESSMDLPADLVTKPAPAPAAKPVGGTGPMPVPPPPPTPIATARPVAAMPVDEIDVELVTLPTGKPRAADSRSLLDLNRRDFIMLGAGGTLVALAVGIGVGLAKVLGGTPRPANPEGK